MGWSSSSSPVFDFQANGNALPMYALLGVALVVFLAGCVLLYRGLGPRREQPRAAGGLGRLIRHALLQRRLLRARPLGWVHLPIFWGFVALALGSAAIMLDTYLLRPLGLAPGRGWGFKLFQASLDAFGVAFLVGVGLAIFRRLSMRPAREAGEGRMLPVLWTLLAIGGSGFVLEGLRIRLEGVHEPWAFAGSALASWLPAAASSAAGTIAYQTIWWSHVVMAFGLLAAIPFTALRHALTAPAHILSTDDRPRGALTTPFKLKDLLRAGTFDVKVGANAIEDFSWRERLGFAACAEAGYCRDACPAAAAGTPLSPMKLVAALRSAENGDFDRHEALAEEAVWSCTLCGACSQACPSLVDPAGSIVQLRRGLAASNRLGRERTAVLANLTHAGNPYGSSRAARDRLRDELGGTAGADLLYWIGCAAVFDTRARKVAAATAGVLRAAGVRFDVLGPDEACCGDPARRIGEEGLFQHLAAKNIETIERRGATRVLTHCAHCFNTLRNEYSDLGARFEVLHHAAFLDSLIRAGAIEPAANACGTWTLHDACYAGRLNGVLEAPRSALRSIPGAVLKEMEHAGERASCCGAGGGNYWHSAPGGERVSTLRLREARATNADTLVTECPFCLKMLETAAGPDGLRVRDIAEVVADSLVEARVS